MSKKDWGIKRICPSCGIKFYDFNKSPILCPDCNFEFDRDLLLKSRKGRSVLNKIEEVSSGQKQSSKEKSEKIDISEYIYSFGKSSAVGVDAINRILEDKGLVK